MAQLVVALRFKSEICGFDPRWSPYIFHYLNPSGRTMDLGSTQPRTDMSTSDISWGVKAASV